MASQGPPISSYGDGGVSQNVRRSLIGVWRPADAPCLFAAVMSKQWQLVDMLLDEETHRRHLGYADSNGYTALHYASWSSTVPLHVVEKMIAFGPQKAICRGTVPKGRTPLHFAAWSGQDDVVHLLVEKCPEAASILDQCGKSPLCDACTRNRSVSVLEALIDADPKQIAVTNKWGRTPATTFFRLWHGWACNSYRSQITTYIDRLEYVAKAVTILEAEYRYKHGMLHAMLHFDNRCLLEAAIESQSCPPFCVKILFEAHEQEVPLLKDGSSLLHVALRVAGEGEIDSFKYFFKCDKCHETLVAPEDDSDDHPPRMFFGADPNRPHFGALCEGCTGDRRQLIQFNRVTVVNKETSNINTLISLCPALARVANEQGQKPLFQALHCNRQWFSGIQLILSLDRESLGEQDPGTRLYPFMLAACLADEEFSIQANERPHKRQKVDSSNDDSTTQESPDEITARIQLTTVYRLLVEDPSVLCASLSRRS